MKEASKVVYAGDFAGGTAVKNLPASARVLSLIWEDSTCFRATKPGSHNY